MIDKHTARILARIAHICEDGSYKIIEKSELEKDAAKIAELDAAIKFLKNSEMVDVKYADETQYCVAVLPKGRVAVEQKNTDNPRGRIAASDVIFMGIVVGVCAFVGALLGTIIGGLL